CHTAACWRQELAALDDFRNWLAWRPETVEARTIDRLLLLIEASSTGFDVHLESTTCEIPSWTSRAT
ncbi:MAG TPA: hypothetical protein VD701_05860, partial [Steroidobacteraceae bacterium]|nr:hypothetical protein [Steroidobacteraceae bacterium]